MTQFPNYQMKRFGCLRSGLRGSGLAALSGRGENGMGALETRPRMAKQQEINFELEKLTWRICSSWKTQS
jgi:hypothetical protein